MSNRRLLPSDTSLLRLRLRRLYRTRTQVWIVAPLLANVIVPLQSFWTWLNHRLRIANFVERYTLYVGCTTVGVRVETILGTHTLGVDDFLGLAWVVWLSFGGLLGSLRRRICGLGEGCAD